MPGIASGTTTPKPGATQPLQARAHLRDHTSEYRLGGEARGPTRSVQAIAAKLLVRVPRPSRPLFSWIHMQ